MNLRLGLAILCSLVPATVHAGWVLDQEFGDFSSAKDIAVDSSGNVYVADGNSRAQVFTADGQYLRELGGFLTLRGLAIDENDVVYFLEGCRVYRYTADLIPLGSWDSCIGQGDLQSGKAIDVSNGIAYVATVNNVLKFTTDGVLLDQFEYGWSGIHVSEDGTIWVSSTDGIGLVRCYPLRVTCSLNCPPLFRGKKPVIQGTSLWIAREGFLSATR